MGVLQRAPFLGKYMKLSFIITLPGSVLVVHFEIWTHCENQHGNIRLAVLCPLHTMNTCMSLFVHKSVTGQWLTDVHCRI